MAGILDGLPSVEKCRLYPDEYKLMGCEKPPQLVVAGIEYETDVITLQCGEDVIAFYRHPDLFITDSTLFWLEEYTGIKTGIFPPVPFLDRHSAWLGCKRVYESYLKGFKRANTNSRNKIHSIWEPWQVP